MLADASHTGGHQHTTRRAEPKGPGRYTLSTTELIAHSENLVDALTYPDVEIYPG